MARGDEVSESLLRAAGDLLNSEGPAALTVRRIAAVAGVSTMNVYSRFGGKDGVVEELFIDGFRRLAEAVGDTPPNDDPLDDLMACGAGYRRFALENPTMYSIMFERAVPDFEPSEGALAIAQEALQRLVVKLARAMDAGLLTPTDPLPVAACIWGTCHGIVSLELKQVGQHVSWPEVYQRACTTLLVGLGAPARSASTQPSSR